jgi:hypothetical protein
MSKKVVYEIVVGGAALILTGSIVKADWVSEPGDCTLGNYHYNDTECVVCDVDVDGKGCEIYRSGDYKFACDNESDSDEPYQEIYCRPSPGTKGPAGDKPGTSDKGCTVIGPSGSGSYAVYIALALAFLIIAVRRIGESGKRRK